MPASAAAEATPETPATPAKPVKKSAAAIKAADDAGRDTRIEDMLTRRGFTWEYTARLALTEFDPEKSLENQARIGQPLKSDTVAAYVAALANGDVFPAVLAAETQLSRQLIIVDGNHRFAAHAKAGRKAIDTYIITGASSQAIAQLTFEANTKHGLPTSESERIYQGLYLINSTGMSAEKAAHMLGVSVSKLRQASKIDEADGRAEDVGLPVKVWTTLQPGVKVRLNQINTDEGFKAMTQLVIDAGLKHEEISEHVNRMAPLRSSKLQTEYVERTRSAYAERLQKGGVKAAKGRQRRSEWQAFAMAMGQVNFLPSSTAIVSKMQPGDKIEAVQKVDAALARLNELREALLA